MMNIIQTYDELGIRFLYAKVSFRDYGRAFFSQQQLVENTENIVVSADFKCIENDKVDLNDDIFVLILDYFVIKQAGKLFQENNVLKSKNICRQYVVNLMSGEDFNKVVNYILGAKECELEMTENILASYGKGDRLKGRIEGILSAKEEIMIRDSKIASFFGEDFYDLIENNRDLDINLGCALIDGIFELFVVPFKMKTNLSMTLSHLYATKKIEEITIKKIEYIIYIVDVSDEKYDPDLVLDLILSVIWDDRNLHLKDLGNNIKEALMIYVEGLLDNKVCINNVIGELSQVLIHTVPNLTLFNGYLIFRLPAEEKTRYIPSNKFVDVDVYNSAEEALSDCSYILCDDAEWIIGGYSNHLYLQPRNMNVMYKDYIFPSKFYNYKRMTAMGMSGYGLVAANSRDDIMLLGDDELAYLCRYDENKKYTVLDDKVYVEYNDDNMVDDRPYYIDLKSGKIIDYTFYNNTSNEKFLNTFGFPFNFSKSKKEIKIGTFDIIDEEKLIYTSFKASSGNVIDGITIHPPLYTFKGRVIFNLSKGKALISYNMEIEDSALKVLLDIYGLKYSDCDFLIQDNPVDNRMVGDKYINEVYIYDYFDEDF